MELTPASQTVFMLSGMEAEALKSKVIDNEHLFLGLLKSEDILSLGEKDFLNLNANDVSVLKDEVSALVAVLKECGLDCKPARRRLRRHVKDSQKEEGQFSGHRSPRCREVFNSAVDISKKQGADKISVFHLVQALLLRESLPLNSLFSDYGLTPQILLKRLSGDKTVPQQEPPHKIGPQQPAKKEEPRKTATPILEKFGRDIIKIAQDGKIDPIIGRSEEIKKIAQILCQKKKNNPVLVGDAGVGKTCVVEGLALKCIDPKAPPVLKNLKIYEVSMASLVAGTMYRGQFEERLENLIKEASSNPNIVIFIDEIHMMIGAGGSMDAANILKPALARGSIKCIGATTTAEYRNYIEKDSALERRFQLVWVDEPTRDEAVAILTGLRPKFEEHHGVTITDDAIKAAVELSMRYLIDFRLPDKAIDLIDQACAQSMLRTLSFVEGASVQSKQEIGRREIAGVVSQRTRIPLDSLIVEESERYLHMENALKTRLKGQDQAVREVAEAIRTAKAGLKDPRRPVGVFLFLGSTGTGKTELAKALAEFLFYDETKLIRIDMSEYQEKHSVAKLIGAPPGYVGYQDEGVLSGQVRTNPYSVVLFDEIEKAHPDIFDIFLQIFDEGMLTDAKGRRINFRESIIILTSNLGSSIVGKSSRPIGIKLEEDKAEGKPRRSIGISFDDQKTRLPEDTDIYEDEKWKDYEKNILETVARTLRPELLNRIQKKIIFYPLGEEIVKKIIQKILAGINHRLSSRGITVRLADGVEEFLMLEGYSERDGARQMERVMENYIVQPLSKEILEGRIKSGEIIEVDVSDSGVSLLFRSLENSS
ncbi:MAG: ATP-dependent Clp protease ATP-binding subunit [Thermodesulfobacteriota bacterium]